MASVSQPIAVAVAPPRPTFRRPLLLVAAACGLGLTALTVITYANPFLALDASVERAAQSVNVGPLTAVFDLYREIGGPFGLLAEGIVFAIVLLLNRHSWRLLIAGAIASGWYFLISTFIIRIRPSVPDVLRVTEHPSASSYPSGHTILFVFYAVAAGFRPESTARGSSSLGDGSHSAGRSPRSSSRSGASAACTPAPTGRPT